MQLSHDPHSPLPHPLHSPGELELCLLTKSDKTTTKELLESKGIKGVTKVSRRRSIIHVHVVSIFHLTVKLNFFIDYF